MADYYNPEEIKAMRDGLKDIGTTLSSIQVDVAELKTDMKWLKEGIGDVTNDVDKLQEFRWKTYGACMVISGAISIVGAIGIYLIR